MNFPQKPDKIKLSIQSEFAPLDAVMVHRPGNEMDRLTPENLHELLFEDFPFLPRMEEEHDQFCDAIRSCGARVVYLRNLVSDIVENPQARIRLVMEACDISGNAGIAGEMLESFNSSQIVSAIMTGLTVREFQAISGSTEHGIHPDQFLILPSPNSYFTRDPAVVFGDGVISCNAYFPARIRETAVTLAVMQLHPVFEGTEVLFGDSDEEDRPLTIEGGDIVILSKDALAIGRSERTRGEAIEHIAAKLLRSKRAKRVYEIGIPPERIYMHLDTVFTIVGPHTVVIYPLVFEKKLTIRRFESDKIGVVDDRPFEQIMSDELGGQLQIVRVGDNDSRYASREQHSAGSNTLAVAPNKVISYERNVHTNNALKSAGVDVIEIRASELVRGLGGPRCMSMPLRRTHT